MSPLVSTSSANEFENWDVLQKFLPEGWEEQAKLCGAMKRARYIKSPEAVLRILLLHLANRCSFRRGFASYRWNWPSTSSYGPV